MSSCTKHPFDAVAGMCGRCAYEFCRECLVFTHGPAKPPHCIPCALVLAGVKTNGGNAPRLPKKELRAELKAQKQALKAAARSDATVGPPPEPPQGNRSPVDFPDLDWAALAEAEAAFKSGKGNKSVSHLTV
jgi:hypothetical protein